MSTVTEVPVCHEDHPIETIEMIFAHEMRAARIRSRRTTEQVAAALRPYGVDIDPTTVTRMERHQRRIRLDEAVAIAFALEIPIAVHVGAGDRS